MKSLLIKYKHFSRHKTPVITEGDAHKSYQLLLMKDSLPDLTIICGIEREPLSHIPVLHNAVSNV
jgi:hypothetical protein